MLRSMTGYASVEAKIGDSTYRLYIKAVNHRFTELKCRMPRSWQPLEIDLRGLVQRKIERGSADFWLDESGSPEKTSEKISSFFSKLNSALQKSEKFSFLTLPSMVRAMILARYPDLWLHEEEVRATLSFDEVLPFLEKLLLEFDKSRQSEGKKLQETLLAYSSALRKLWDEIQKNATQLRQDWEKQFLERIHKVSEELKIQKPDETRILHEILLLAERRDIAEEIQRIDSHLGALQELLQSDEKQIGKKLDFYVQELHREWTTLGNKIQNAQVAKTIVEAKLTIEKIREQAANLV